jgi:hypothetical protein
MLDTLVSPETSLIGGTLALVRGDRSSGIGQHPPED